MTTVSKAEAPSKGDLNGQRQSQPAVVSPSGEPLSTLNAAVFKDVSVSLRAKLGDLTLTIEELLALKSGSVVKLNATLNDLVELQLNQSVVARGELVAVGDHFGIRIVEIAQGS